MNVNILHIGKTGGSAIRDSLKQFDKQMTPHGVLNFIGVNRPFSSYLGDIEHINKCRNNILYVGVMETLEYDFNQICNLLDIKSELIKDEVISHKTPKEYENIKFLSEKGKQNIRKLYDYDYKIFELLRDIKKIDNEKFKIIS